MNLPTDKDKEKEANLFHSVKLIEETQHGNGGYAYPPSREAIRSYLNFFKPIQDNLKVINTPEVSQDNQKLQVIPSMI